MCALLLELFQHMHSAIRPLLRFQPWLPLRRFSTEPFAGAIVPLSRRGAKSVAAELRSLRRDVEARQRAKQLVLFGRTMVEEHAARDGRWQHIFAAPTCQLKLANPQPAPIALGHAELTLAAGVECADTDACACVIPLPVLQPPTPTAPRVLVLDALSDPGNLGSVIRSALAFDFSLVLLGPGSCDPFNEKVVRSSMGACVNAPIYSCDEKELRRMIEERKQVQPNLQVLVSDVAAAGCVPLFSVRLAPSQPVWLLVGNESHGVRPSLRGVGARVHIPMSAAVESLNASVAAAILMQHVHSHHKHQV
jgi:tRNA G18 (ribose-2'-O)-methylase SpoU